MKTLKYIIAMGCIALVCGCSTVNSRCSDGPVAPDDISYERSDSGDPVLPKPNVWWN